MDTATGVPISTPLAGDRHAGERAGTSVSIVLEWENALLSDVGRVATSLGRIGAQMREVCAGRAGARFELLIGYDSNRIDEASVRRSVEACLPAGWAAPPRFFAFPDAGYYGLKNATAQHAHGDILIFLDSDVVPERGWLDAILGSFDDPGVRVVGSAVFVDGESLYEKAMRAGWFFPLPPRETTLGPARHVFANSMAIRRDLFLSHPYPAMAGQTRGACDQFQRTLRDAGVPLHLHSGARVGHPPPNGLRHFTLRAMSEGRDHLLEARRRGKSGPIRSIDRARRKWMRGVANAAFRGRQAGIRLWEAPGVAAILGAYYALYFAGDVLQRVRPSVAARLLNLGGHVH